jgi:hypothetical protein
VKPDPESLKQIERIRSELESLKADIDLWENEEARLDALDSLSNMIWELGHIWIETARGQAVGK